MKICLKCGRAYGDATQVCAQDQSPLELLKDSSGDPMIGRTLAGRYTIMEKIGQGGMGSVYRAVHLRMNRVCAIKILAPSPSDGEAAAARFHREAQLASKIDDPHAVTIYDFGESES